MQLQTIFSKNFKMSISDPQRYKPTMSIKREVIKVKQAVISQEKTNANKILITTNVKEPLKEIQGHQIFSRFKTLLLH